MSLDLGELAASVTVDTRGGRTALSSFVGDLNRFSDQADAAGESAGERFGDGFKEKGKAAAAAGGAIVGTALIAGVNEVLDRQAAGGLLAARLGLDPQEQERLGRIAGNVYANAYGDSMDEVNTAIWAVRSSLRGLESGKEISRATKDALNFAAAFDVDVSRSVQVASQLVRNGLVKDSRAAFDLITRGSQRVGSALTEDLIDTADEYGQFFKLVGLDGPEAFKLLIQSTDKGAYGIDKTADAIKEFSALAVSGDKPVGQAFESIGLNAGKMADDVASGGDRARDAFEQTVEALLDVEDPSKRAQAALALFGTPLEDLSVGQIPRFLDSLTLTEGGLKGVEGSAKDMDRALGDNAQAGFQKMKRGLEKDVITFLSEKALPFIKDDVVPTFESIGDALDNVPSWAIKGTVGGVLGLVAAGKLGSLASDLRGLRGGGLGSGGGVGKMTPVPVFVTNAGGLPGTDSSGVVTTDEPKKGSKPRGGGKGAGIALLLASVFGDEMIDEIQAEALWPWKEGPFAPKPTPKGGGERATDRPIVTPNRFMPADAWAESDKAVTEKHTQALRDFYLSGDRATESAERLGIQTDANEGKFEAFWRTTGKTTSRVDELRASVDLLSQMDARPSVELTGVERAMGQLATLRAGIDALAERGVDNSVPYLHGGSASSQHRDERDFDDAPRVPRSPFDGATFNVTPHNYDDFMRQMQRRARMRGNGGFG